MEKVNGGFADALKGVQGKKIEVRDGDVRISEEEKKRIEEKYRLGKNWYNDGSESAKGIISYIRFEWRTDPDNEPEKPVKIFYNQGENGHPISLKEADEKLVEFKLAERPQSGVDEEKPSADEETLGGNDSKDGESSEDAAGNEDVASGDDLVHEGENGGEKDVEKEAHEELEDFMEAGEGYYDELKKQMFEVDENSEGKVGWNSFNKDLAEEILTLYLKAFMRGLILRNSGFFKDSFESKADEIVETILSKNKKSSQ